MQEKFQNGSIVLADQAAHKQKPRARVRGLGVVLTLFIVDLIAKQYFVITNSNYGNWWFKFKLFYNEGIVFSLPVPNWIYLPIALAIFLIFIILLRWATKHDPASILGLLFIILGAFSNLLDRFIHEATIDYLLFFDRSAINIADIMIIIGVILFVRSKNTDRKLVYLAN
ncbi:signal peptidase II [Patescibacteria group bacterium]|nr:signal peptidase II [Patescibacteria group bacterium]MBU1029121.1 signal peptidase II [Patescibacteria group bacterium]